MTSLCPECAFANCTAGDASELFINRPKLLVNCVFYNACLPPTTTDSYKVGIDVEIIANLSREQLRGRHRQLKPNLNLLVIEKRALATFLR